MPKLLKLVLLFVLILIAVSLIISYFTSLGVVTVLGGMAISVITLTILDLIGWIKSN